MHLIVRDGAGLDEIGEPRDLGLPPADFVLLSFSDSDLAMFRAGLPLLDRDGLSSSCHSGSLSKDAASASAHFINLAALRHPISVDLFVEKTVPGTKTILLRLLGGLDYWRYGAEELSRACRRNGVTLAVLAGDGRPDFRLPPLSTVAPEELDALDRALCAGGADHAAQTMAALLARASGTAIMPGAFTAEARPEFGVYRETEKGEGGAITIVFYRSFLLANDVRPIDALFDAVAGLPRTGTVRAYYVPSLKAPHAAAWLRERLQRDPADVIVNTTAFSARGEEGCSVLDDADCPVIQAVLAGSSEEAWRASPRGLSSADLAMHVVLPEIDGRLFGGAISFKALDASGGVFHRPHAEGIAQAAALAASWVRLRRKPVRERKIALILSTYPGRPDQIAHAVGLDGPASAVRVAERLRDEGYETSDCPKTAAQLTAALRCLTLPGNKGDNRLKVALREYEALFSHLPRAVRDAVVSAWGDPKDDPAFAEGAATLPVLAFGNFIVALQPERGFLRDRKTGYHDPNLPPRHSYIAFYLWLRECAGIDALIHLGAHGTLEWLPGKAVALSEACVPQALLGAIPVVYPFIVNDPGEAAQAKRRISALTIGHNTPPLVEAEPPAALREVERLLDEYAAADGLDKRRRDRLAGDILAAIAKGGLERACGIDAEMSESEALTRVDAFLCDVKELSIRDGLHRLDRGELDAIMRALDGRFIEPGPSGAPSRGRPDVLPTGRNLYSMDPRSIPTPLACENGARLAEALVSRYVEDRGEWPRSMVLDLWGSQTLRTGGEEFAAALALIGVKPTWDYSSFRVTGFEIIPLMTLNRPRVDVTLRISGLLRDMFPSQLTFFHAAVQRVAARNEERDDNPLCGHKGELYRIFGAPDGSYGAGVTARIDASDWETRADLGESYIEASSTAYRGEGAGIAARPAFETAIREASCFVHVQDHRETDVLSSLDYAAHEGGLVAAAATVGNGAAALYHGDMSNPCAPRTRTLAEETARILHGRALSPRWIEGQMRHGFRGAAELAGTVDAAFAFAATADAIPSEGFEHLYEAYLGDPTVAGFIAHENDAALAAMQSRFKEAIARSLWKPRRNDLSALEGRPSK